LWQHENTHFTLSTSPAPLWTTEIDNYEAQGTAGQATDDTAEYDVQNIRFASRVIKIIIRT